MEIIALHHRAVAAVAPILARVRPIDLGLPTPCTGWDLRVLLEHMTGQDHGFAAAVRAGDETDVDIAAFAPRPLEDDPAAAATTSSAAAGAAFTEAATDPARTVWLAEFRQRLPLEQVAGFHLIDTLVHGWDVAVTLGLAVDYDDDLIAAGLTVAERVPTGAFRELPESPFAPALEASGSDRWERTLTLLGRNPLWTPTRTTATPTR
ncbi:TIGR03086 family metal-binding protein [Pseudonocardia yunnanensis]|uniref:TIGR03086 family metal-binding protein n=1 Tax=Pseudonocardia yunnanensis TaxID=58107 RepID=A0ABW4F678_9PSEU